MKHVMSMGMFLGFMALFAACGLQATKEPPEGVRANETMAEAVAQALVNGDFDAVRRDFDDRMQNSLSSGKLREVWTQYTESLGTFKDFGPTYIEYVKTSPLNMFPNDIGWG